MATRSEDPKNNAHDKETEHSQDIEHKEPAKTRAYLLPSETIVIIDFIHMVDGRSKPDIVADSIKIAAVLWKYLPPEKLNLIRDQDLESLFKGISFRYQLPKKAEIEESGSEDIKNAVNDAINLSKRDQKIQETT